jgi:hypothetical protein
MVGREELQAKEAGAFTGSGALLLTAETVHKEPWCSTPREDGVRRRTTGDRHLPPLVGSGDMLWSLLPRYSAEKGGAKSYAVGAAASSLGGSCRVKGSDQYGVASRALCWVAYFSHVK